MKTFNVEEVQQQVVELHIDMVGKIYRHFKGGLYVVTNIDVDEETGIIRVSYISCKYGYRWSRTLANFTEPGRFKREDR